MLKGFLIKRCVVILLGILLSLVVVDIVSWAIAPCQYGTGYSNNAYQCTYRGGIVISGLTFILQFIGGLTPEAWTALATIAIASFTVALFKVGRGQLKQLATSVNIAERSLIDLEGPFLYPVIVAQAIQAYFKDFVMFDHPTSPHFPVEPVIEIAFKNYGRTVALPQLVIATLFVGGPDDTLDEKSAVAQEAVIGGGDTGKKIECKIFKPITFDDYQALKKETARIFLRGSIVFSDIFGNDHFQWFCLGWNMKTNSFSAWGSKRNKRTRLKSGESSRAAVP